VHFRVTVGRKTEMSEKNLETLSVSGFSKIAKQFLRLCFSECLKSLWDF